MNEHKVIYIDGTKADGRYVDIADRGDLRIGDYATFKYFDMAFEGQLHNVGGYWFAQNACVRSMYGEWIAGYEFIAGKRFVPNERPKPEATA